MQRQRGGCPNVLDAQLWIPRVELVWHSLGTFQGRVPQMDSAKTNLKP